MQHSIPAGGTPPLLGVNIDHVATLRQARGTRYPDPVDAGFAVERAGADLVTVHLREDRRHIQDRDVVRLAEVLHARLNLEIACTEEMLAIAERIAPSDCCLVPERREEITTEGGLDVMANADALRGAIERLHAAGTIVSLFVDPDRAQIEAAAAVGAQVVELHSGSYANARGREAVATELERLRAAVRCCTDAGVQANVGHGLHYQNVVPVAAIAGAVEFNIGHAIVGRAVFDGLDTAVRDMKALLLEGRRFTAGT